MKITRRGFLQVCGGLMATLVAKPVSIFVPPREPYVFFDDGINGLYSHLGVLPQTKELGGCEGVLLDIAEWDGIGFPCLIRNACTFGHNPPQVWIYDFDLWNFRHDDKLQEEMGRRRFAAEVYKHKNWATWYARRRFGDEFEDIVLNGKGMLAR